MADYHRLRILFETERYAIVQEPGGNWSDNSGVHYGGTTYWLVDKQCTYRRQVGLMDAETLQHGGRPKLAQWKKLITERDGSHQVFASVNLVKASLEAE